jgi:hypothetical protein
MSTFDSIEGCSISKLQDFLKDLDDIRLRSASLGHTWYFRGDQSKSMLRPSVGQDLDFAGQTLVADEITERKLLNRFKRFSYGHLDRVQSDWEALFLARHYGLPTRILDWTGNPLVALYFACSPEKSEAQEGNVWGILRIPCEDEDLDIFDRDHRNPISLFAGAMAVKVIYPVYNSARIAAQKGVFTWHSHPHSTLKDLKGETFAPGMLDICRLVRWPVNTSASECTRTTLLKEPEQLGVNQRSIFPELGGLAKGLWHTEVLWNGKSKV